MTSFEQSFTGAGILSGDANNDIVLGTDGGLFLQETETTLAYNTGTSILTYTNEAGTATPIDLSALTTDIYVDGASFNAATSVLTLTDNNGTTGDVTINLSELQGSLTDNSDGTYSYLNGDGTTAAVVVDTRAASNTIADAGGIITATNVEDALQEIATELNGTILTLSGDTGTDQALTIGNTLKIAGATNGGIATDGAATDTLNVKVDINDLALAGEAIDPDADFVGVYNASTGETEKVLTKDLVSVDNDLAVSATGTIQTGAPLVKNTNTALSTFDRSFTGSAGAFVIDPTGDLHVGTTAAGGTATPDSVLSTNVKAYFQGGSVVADNRGDEAELLWLRTERPWYFRQEGSGATTELDLLQHGGQKWFNIGHNSVTTNEARPFRFFVGRTDATTSDDHIFEIGNPNKVEVDSVGDTAVRMGYRLEKLAGGVTPTTGINSDIDWNGSVGMAIRTVTADASAGQHDYTILVDTSAGAVTITLPAAATFPRRILNIKKVTTDTDTVTIDSTAGNIDGVATQVFGSTGELVSYSVQSDGTNWFII